MTDRHVTKWFAGILAVFCLFFSSNTLLAAEVSGTVFDTSGNPLIDGSVDIVVDDPCGDPDYIDYGWMDSNGIYTITGLSAGTYYLRTDMNSDHLNEWWATATASSSDCNNAQSFTVEVNDVVEGMNFQLGMGAEISGTVTGNGGVPATEGYIDIYKDSQCGGADDYYDYASLNADGTYTITGLPEGTYYLHSDATGNYFNEWWATSGGSMDCNEAEAILVGADEIIPDRDFQLAPGATIAGTVTDDKNNIVTSGSVKAYTSEDPCEENELVATGDIQEDGSYLIFPLPAGDYYLSTTTSNYASEWWANPDSSTDCALALMVPVASQEEVTGKNFVLNAVTISGTVYDDAESPVTGGYVDIYTGSTCYNNTKTLVASVAVESNGQYTTPSLQPDDYYLKTRTENFVDEWWTALASDKDCVDAEPVTVTLLEDITGKDFELDEPKVTISGTVTDQNGTPITDGRMTIYIGTPCGSTQYVDRVDLDSTGNYSFQEIPPGNYYLKTYDGDFIDEWWDGQSGSPDCSEAELIEQSETGLLINKNFQLDMLATISGVATDQNGNPVTSSRVKIYTGDPCGTTDYITYDYTDSSGAYIFVVPPGNYYMLAFPKSSLDLGEEWWADPTSSPDCSEAEFVEITTFGQEEIGKNFQLNNPLATISGTVTDQNGIPVASDKVKIYTGDPCGETDYITYDSTDSNGVYTVSLPPGNYYMQALPRTSLALRNEWWAASASSPDCSEAEFVELTTFGQEETGKNFQLNNPLATISGTVTDQNGIPVTSGSVRAYTGDPCENKTQVANSSIESNGEYTIPLSPGNYFLLAEPHSSTVLTKEWWTDQTSSLDCSEAQAVEITTFGQIVTGKDFQLNPLATISGTVTDQSENPVRSRWVYFYTGDPCGSKSSATSDYTDSNGQYTVQLPPGQYYIQTTGTSSSGLANEWWAASASTLDCLEAEAVEITTFGQIVIGIDFQLHPLATISGTLTDQNGNPVTARYVGIYTGDPCGVTDRINYDYDTSGTYTLSVVPGTYYLKAIPDSDHALAEEWWAASASSTDCSEAQTVEVTTYGQEVTGKNFQLTNPLATISGTVTDQNGMPIAFDRVYAYTSDPCVNSSAVTYPRADSNGKYTITIPPGSYYLIAKPHSDLALAEEWWANPSSPYCSDAQAVEVSTFGQAVTNIDFQLHLLATISGTVTDQNGNPVTSRDVNLYTGDPCGDKDFINDGDMNSSGEYTVQVIPGSYYMIARPDSDLLLTDEWWNETASSPDCSEAQAAVVTTFGEAVTGKNFQLHQSATISGTVTDQNENPVTAARIMIYTGDPCGGRDYVAQDSLNSNGEYTVQLSPGSYYLRALPHYGIPLIREWWAATASSPDCSVAQPVAVTFGDVVTGKDFSLDAPPLPGDLNDDGTVDLTDLILAMQVMIGTDPAINSTGDVDGDGRTGMSEALYILQQQVD